MVEPTIEVFARPSGDVEVRTTFNAFFVAEIQRKLPQEIIDRAAEALVADFLAKRGPAIVASIDLDHVLKLAVAKVVTRLSEEGK